MDFGPQVVFSFTIVGMPTWLNLALLCVCVLTVLCLLAHGCERQDGGVHQHPGGDVPQCSPDAHAPETQRHLASLCLSLTLSTFFLSLLFLCFSPLVSSLSLNLRSACIIYVFT